MAGLNGAPSSFFSRTEAEGYDGLGDDAPVSVEGSGASRRKTTSSFGSARTRSKEDNFVFWEPEDAIEGRRGRLSGARGRDQRRARSSWDDREDAMAPDGFVFGGF
jgi:hypothetical protein